MLIWPPMSRARQALHIKTSKHVCHSRSNMPTDYNSTNTATAELSFVCVGIVQIVAVAGRHAAQAALRIECVCR
jgi:hypothetical protein